MIEAHQNFLRLRTVGPQLILVRLARAVNSQDRAESGELKPAHEQFAVGRIIWIAGNKAPDIGRPVRKSRERKVQTGRNLAAESKEIGINIARPRRDRISLSAGERRSRQDINALLIAGTSLPFIN